MEDVEDPELEFTEATDAIEVILRMDEFLIGGGGGPFCGTGGSGPNDCNCGHTLIS